MPAPTDGADLSLFLQIEQGLPVRLDRRAVLWRPVHLIEINPLNLKSAQRTLDLAANARWGAHSPWQGVAVRGVGNQPAFGTLALWNGGKGSGDDLLRMPEAIDCGCVDPVDPARHGVTDRGHGVPVVLAAPADRPIAANHPGPEAHARNLHVGRPELPNRKCAFTDHGLSFTFLFVDRRLS